MKKGLMVLMAMFALGTTAMMAQMSDGQVVSYVKASVEAGKNEKQIGKELMARGVTVAQLERLKEQYENSHGGETISTEVSSSSAVRRVASEGTHSSVAAVDAVSVSMEAPDERGKLANARNVFGHDMFRSSALTFEPNQNIPTPENYVLGPGDEVIIEVWGDNEATVRETISPEGNIKVSQIGKLYLNGMSIKEANNYVRHMFSQKYAGVMGDEPNSDIKLTLGQIRTIQINIFGEVGVPGTYRLSSLTTLFNALHRAGGITNRGSIRNIEVVRNGKKIHTVDMYPFLFTGKMDSDIRLQDGDVIRVPVVGMLANIEGQIKKPMYYELKKGETVKNLIDYAGGFESDALSDEVRLVRQTTREREISTIKSSQFASYKLEDGDVVTVMGNTIDRFANRVEIRGAVFRQGMFELSNDIRTVKDLVKRADGLMEDAFTDRVRLLRQKEDLTPEVLSLNLTGIMKGIVADVPLRKNDILVIPNIHELKDLGTLTISGYVAHPGTFPFAEHSTIEDLILQAGGLLDGASAVRVEVSRRLKDVTSEMPSEKLAEVFTFSFDPTLKLDNESNFELKPYDVVRIRKSPGYSVQSSVAIQGEVPFPGGYTLVTINERISDLVKRAGGLTKTSYVEGARLVRTMTADERGARAFMRRAIQSSPQDIIQGDKMLNESYTVGINLKKALDNPGSAEDVILREGDLLIIPEYNNIVTVEGGVLLPNAITYEEGKRLRYYVGQAGGYDKLARKHKSYVIHMNGHISKGRWAKVTPGSRVIVPSKPYKEKNPAAALQTTSTIISMSTVLLGLINILK